MLTVAEVLSQIVKQISDQNKLAESIAELKLLTDVAGICRNSPSFDLHDLDRAARLAAERMGFNHVQVYLFDASENALKPQMENGNHDSVSLAMKDNPFVKVFSSGKGKLINVEATSKKDFFFEEDLAMVVPLISQGERLSTVAWWQRRADIPQYNPSSKDLGMAIATTLAQAIHIGKLKG